ncbi:MAG: PilZ domain-containing protein [Clostridiales bacterium]
MKLKMGDIVSIKHYSGFEFFNSIILDSDNEIIVIKTTESFSNLNIFVDDPIVLGFSYKRDVYICECIIQKINVAKSLSEIKIISEKKVTDSRLHERFPVSLFAEINDSDSGKYNTILIRNISASGLMVVSKDNFNIDSIIDLSIFIENNIIKVMGLIVRKSKRSYSYEYGVKLIFKDISSKTLIEKYIIYLKKEQYQVISNLKNGIIK